MFSTSVQRIDFTLGVFHVDWRIGFISVHIAILQGRIKIDIDPKKLPDGAGCAYSPHTDSFIFPNPDFGQTLDDKQAIVHESVHAINDIQARTLASEGMTELMGEAAAYVADALFYIYESPTPDYAADPILITANEIARSIVNMRGAKVGNADAGRLMVLIMNNTVYQKLGDTWVAPSRADGVPY